MRLHRALRHVCPPARCGVFRSNHRGFGVSVHLVTNETQARRFCEDFLAVSLDTWSYYPIPAMGLEYLPTFILLP